MEPNSKRATVTNVNDSSVNSLVSSVGQLDETTSGPINGLPNEIVKHIVAQLKQKPKSYHNYKYYYDVKLLVQLRLVCTRWRTIVEDFCREKKSLCVNSGHESELDFDNSVPMVVMNSIQSAQFFSVMPKLFPNIVQLQIGCLPNLEDTEMANVALNISRWSSLEQLELVGLEKILPFLLPTLSQLEHILVYTNDNYKLTKEEFLQFVDSLGPDCVRVFLKEGVRLNYHNLRQWHSLKPHFFANVTHLQFDIEEDNDEYQQMVHFLSEHASSLELLNLFGQADLVLTTTLLADLGKLTNLTELALCGMRMELFELEEAAAQNQLPALSSVTICILNFVYLEWPRYQSVDEFMRILLSIFPNLIYLKLQLLLEMETLSQKPPEKHEFKQYLDRFPNLSTHIDVSKAGWTIDGRVIPLAGFPFNIHV